MMMAAKRYEEYYIIQRCKKRNKTKIKNTYTIFNLTINYKNVNLSVRRVP